MSRRLSASSRCRIAGSEITYSVELDAEQLRNGVPLLLGHSVVLLLRLGRYAGAATGMQAGDELLRGNSACMARLREQVAAAAHSDLDVARTDIHNLIGFCHFMRKEHEAAIQSFKRVIELDPGSAIDYANIASNYRDMGQTTKAVRYYRLALELDPSIEFARDNLKRLDGSAQ